MLWPSHILITDAICHRFMGMNDPILFAVTGFGAVFPDWMEYIGGKRLLKHRGISHNPYMWILILWIIMGIKCVCERVPSLYVWGYDIDIVWPYFKWFMVGVFMHLAEDSLTMTGIPLTPFFREKRLAFRLFATGSWKEAVLLVAVVVFCFLI